MLRRARTALRKSEVARDDGDEAEAALASAGVGDVLRFLGARVTARLRGIDVVVVVDEPDEPSVMSLTSAQRKTEPTCVKCMALPTCFFMDLEVRSRGDVLEEENMHRHPAAIVCSGVIGKPDMDRISCAVTKVVLRLSALILSSLTKYPEPAITVMNVECPAFISLARLSGFWLTSMTSTLTDVSTIASSIRSRSAGRSAASTLESESSRNARCSRPFLSGHVVIPAATLAQRSTTLRRLLASLTSSAMASSVATMKSFHVR